MTEQQKNHVSVIQKDITDSVNTSITRLQDEGLVIPSNYNYSNALKSAFFALQTVKTGKDDGYKLALEVCTKESIANSLLDMVTQGLNPAKTQCYFVIYKDFGKGTFELQMQRSYFGTQTVIKRLSEVKDIWANVIYQDDVFDYANVKGRETLISHETKFENRDKPIIGAYAIVETAEGDQLLTPMTKNEIDASWSQAKTKNVQQKFPQEMAKRTVINRAAKAFINTSNDSDLLVESINRTTANEYEENEIKQVDPIDELNEEIDQHANKTAIDFEDLPVVPETIETPEKKIIDQTETQETLFNNLNEVAEEPSKRKRDF